MRKAVEAWSFPDFGAQVVMISPAVVSAMSVDSLLEPAEL